MWTSLKIFKLFIIVGIFSFNPLSWIYVHNSLLAASKRVSSQSGYQCKRILYGLDLVSLRTILGVTLQWKSIKFSSVIFPVISVCVPYSAFWPLKIVHTDQYWLSFFKGLFFKRGISTTCHTLCRGHEGRVLDPETRFTQKPCGGLPRQLKGAPGTHLRLLESSLPDHTT